MVQVNQAFSQVASLEFVQGTWLADNGWFFGVVMAALVAVVIIGGIKSIANVTDKIVPIMVSIYVAAALIIIFMNITEVPATLGQIFWGAFAPKAIAGGFVGVLIQGFRRAAFSNEAGVGSASIAHSAVKTNNPASEGLVALLEPFIDTVVVCTMTALVIIITGNHITAETEGVALTSRAFSSAFPWFKYVLALAVLLFAFSTMISWSYYGLKSWTYLFGNSRVSDLTYKVLFCGFVVVGAAASLKAVFDFSDAMIFAMVFPECDRTGDIGAGSERGIEQIPREDSQWRNHQSKITVCSGSDDMKGGGIVPSSLLFVRGCLDLEDEIGSNTIRQRMAIFHCFTGVCRKGDRNLKREYEFFSAFYMDECRQNLGSRAVSRRLIPTGQSDPAVGECVIFISGNPDLSNEGSLPLSDDRVAL